MRFSMRVVAVLLLSAFVMAADKDGKDSGKKLEIEAHVFSWAMTVADVELTARAMRNPVCHELDPLAFTRHPTRTQMYAANVPIGLAVSLLAHHLRKKESKRWALAPLLNGGAHTVGILVTDFGGCRN